MEEMVLSNGSQLPLKSDTTQIDIRRRLPRRISLIVAIGMGWGLIAINSGLTEATLIPSSNPTQAISNSSTLLAQSMKSNEVLEAHNKYRKEVGVPPLKWSNSLASSAQQWANQLASNNRFEHSSTDKGENIWAGSKGSFSPTQMVNSWGSEKKYFISNRLFPNTCRGGGQKCGHYTQIIWKNTTEVGCGLARGAKMDYFVCQYNPPGNYQGEKPF